MSKLAKKLMLGELAFVEASASQHVPYARAARFDRATIETRAGDLMQVVKLKGVSAETAGDADIAGWMHQRHQAIRSIAHPTVALWFTAVRRELSAYPGGEFEPGSFAERLDAKWRQRWERRRFFTNEFYIAIVKRPNFATASKFVSFFDAMFRAGRATASSREDARAKAGRDLADRVQQIVKQLAKYGPEVLSIDESTGMHPALSFLGYLINGEHVPIALPQRDLSRALCWSETAVGAKDIRLTDRSGGKRYSAMVSVSEYPPATFSGMVDGLLRLPYELVVTQSFAFESRTESSIQLHRQEGRYEQVNDDARSLAAELEDARDDVARGALLFGHHQLTVQVTSRARKELADSVATVVSSLTDVGVKCFRETRGLEPAWWSRLPGNRRYAVRSVPISSANMACLGSFHGVPEGRVAGNHWGPAITALETTAGTPYFFNFHVGDVGFTLSVGGTGVGKTTTQGFLTCQSQRVKARLWVFDKDRGAELYVRALGGRYTVIRAGHQTGWNPFQLPDSPRTRSFLVDLLVSMAFGAGSPPAREREQIAWAVAKTMEHETQDRTLSELAAYLTKSSEGDSLWRRLEPWHGKGSMAWLFDNQGDALDLTHDVLGFDMTTLFADQVASGPALAYIFERVTRALVVGDDRGTIISIEELRHFLAFDVFARRLEDWALTARKGNALILASSQMLSHFAETAAGRTLLEMSATQILFPNSRVDDDELVNAWNLSDAEAKLVRDTPRESRCFLVRSLNGSVMVRLDLSDLPDEVAVLSGNAHTVKLCEEIRASVGDNPKDWLPLFFSAIKKDKRP